MEAVKQGSATVGLKNNDFAILVALKRAPSELSSYQEKINKIDEHVGCSIAGLTADGRSLTNYMIKQCLDSKWSNDEPLSISRMVSNVEYKMQLPTQKYGSRPFGVGILIAGFDSQGPHIYYLCPSANSYNCKGLAIGSRSQSARTYLEKHLDTFKNCSLDELIAHGLQSLSDTLPNDVSLNAKNCTVSVVGRDRDFTIVDDTELAEYLTRVKLSKGRDQAAVPEPMAVDAAATAVAMDTAAEDVIPSMPEGITTGADVERMDDNDGGSD